jgi:hypothetical protein
MDETRSRILGAYGELIVLDDDEITRKLMMLIEGECEGLGPGAAAEKYDYTRQRYSQILHKYITEGALALKSRKPGPKTNYRQGEMVVKEIILHRFLDQDASAEIIAQKLRQCGHTISARTVRRVISAQGLEKKTPIVSSQRGALDDPNPTN